MSLFYELHDFLTRLESLIDPIISPFCVSSAVKCGVGGLQYHYQNCTNLGQRGAGGGSDSESSPGDGNNCQGSTIVKRVCKNPCTGCQAETRNCVRFDNPGGK